MDRVDLFFKAHASQHIAVVIGDVVKGQHLPQLGAGQRLVGIQRNAALGDNLDFARIPPCFLRAFADTFGNFLDLRRRRHVDKNPVGNFSDEFRHLRPKPRQINGQVWKARLPRELKSFASLVNLSLIFNSLTGGDFADDVDILTRPLERPVEDPAMPGGDALIGDTESEQQSSAGEILQRRRLNSQGHRTAAIYMVDGGSQFNLPGPARHRREHNDRIRAVRLPFPKSAEADLLRQFDQSRDVGRRVVSRRINLDVIDHTCLPSNS